MPDGRSRKVAYMGTLPKPPEAAIQERLIAARLEQAVAGLCKEERELATAVFDVIADIDTFEGHSDLVIAIQERLDGMVSVQTISALLLKLADSPFLKTLKENDCLDN